MAERVLIVGSVALDDVKTPQREARGVLGGSAVYGSVVASHFAPVDIVGIVGDDFPAAHIQLLQSHGVDTRGLEIVKGGKTFHWGGEYLGEMNEAVTHFTELGVFADFRPVLPAAYRADGFVFLANIDPELQLQVLDQTVRPRLAICDSMNLWINIKREALLAMLRRVDVALLNESEARLLFETHSLPKAAAGLLGLGLKRVIIKKGSYGAQMFSAEGTFAVPAVPLEMVADPTGAGDTFAGGLIGYLATRPVLDETAFRQAIVVGSACASFVVEDFSIARTAALTRPRIAARCRKLLDAIRCDPVVL
ncbi:MAG: PfkB family carbohydrate kinase [bacterium]|nr:PfkB family carbohydrate kinase [bacterium]